MWCSKEGCKVTAPHSHYPGIQKLWGFIMSEGQGGIPKPWVNPIMKYFQFEHLPGHLQLVAAEFKDLANLMNDGLPDCLEKSAGLRKLLEAKDCFVRAALEPKPELLPFKGEIHDPTVPR